MSRGGIVHTIKAGSDGKPVVLNMQGRKVVMQVRVDCEAGLPYKARFIHVNPDLTRTGWIIADVETDSNPAPEVNGDPYIASCRQRSPLTGCEGIAATRSVYCSRLSPVVVEKW